MSEATLHRLVSEIRQLSMEEKTVVMRILQEPSPDEDETVRIEAFHQALLDSGLVTEIRPGRSVERPLQLIDIPGPPISQTLIEERR